MLLFSPNPQQTEQLKVPNTRKHIEASGEREEHATGSPCGRADAVLKVCVLLCVKGVGL